MIYARSIAVILALLLLSLVLWDLDRAVRQADLTLQKIADTAIVVGGAAGNFEKGTRPLATEQKLVADQTLQATKELNSDLLAVATLLSTANSAINTASSSASGLSQKASESLTSLTELSTDAKPILQNLSATSLTLAQGTAEAMPKIQASLENIQETSHDIEGVAQNADTESGLIVDQTRKAFAPKNKFLSILQMVGGGAINGAELYYYFTH